MVDDSGRVLPEVVRVMEICAEADIIFATGHASPQESIALARKAREVGVGKFVVTHANSHYWTMTPDQIKQCIDLGAHIEFCYLPCLWGEGTDPSRSFVSTDLGQAVMPHPVEGMRDCIARLQGAGVALGDIDRLVRRNPAWLLGLDKQE